MFVVRKPWPHGNKFFVAADASLYVFSFFLAKRTDEEHPDPPMLRQAREKKKGPWRGKKVAHSVPSIFTSLLGDLEPGHCVAADSYFGGVQPLNTLTSMGHTGVLACQEKRPSFIFQTHLAHVVSDLSHHGEYAAGTGLLRFDCEGAVPFAAYGVKARKKMFLLSTEHEPGKVVKTTEETTNEEEERETVDCTVPLARKFYTLAAGFVDGVNREVLSYKVKHRHVWLAGALFFWIFRLLCHNAHQIFDASTGQRTDTKSFLEMLARQLCGLPSKPVKPDSVKEHVLKKGTKRRNCAICYWKTGKCIAACNECEKCGVSMHRHCHASVSHADFVLAGGASRPRKRKHT
jgi:hypothetical protein